MALDFNNISMPMAALLASLIGATATITASILQLRMAWKKELLARANHKPVTRKSSRGPVVPLLALLVASAVGGFALAYYVNSKGRANSEALEAELRAKIDELSLSTQRLETVSLNGADSIAEKVRAEEQQRRGNEGNVASVILDKCKSTQGDEQSSPAECSEVSARPIQLCTEIPADATVSSIDLYARADDDTRPWSESRAQAGSDFGGGRFSTNSTERLLSDSAKQVCQELRYWNGAHSITGRLVVHYASGS